MANLFGFKFGNKSETNKNIPSPIKPEGADNVNVSTSYGMMETGFVFGQSETNSLETAIENRWELYQNAEINFAVDEVVSEMVDFSAARPIEVSFKGDDVSDKVKEAVFGEVNRVSELFDKGFNEVLKDWYVQGTLSYFIQLSKDGKSIAALHPVDPWLLTLKKPTKVNVDSKGIVTYTELEPYWLYKQTDGGKTNTIKLHFDSVLYLESGLGKGRSYIDYATKPMNDLLSLENASVIYRVTRAPEKRAFYVDTGQLAPTKAEEMVKKLMNRFKTKTDYNAKTGKLTTNNKNVISATVDYWMPRREGSTGTEIDIINESSNSLSNIIEEVNYFKSKLYSALFIPKSRVEDSPSFNLGNSGAITREEVKFSQMIKKLESEFMKGILHLLEVSLTRSGQMTSVEWETVSNELSIGFASNDFFAETKRLETISERISVMDSMGDYVGDYFSREFVQKNIMGLNDDEIVKMDKDIKAEKSKGYHSE